MNEFIIAVPIGLGTLIAALVGVGKLLGWIKEDQGGKVSLGINLGVGTLLFVASNFYGVDVEGESLQPLWQIFGLISVLIAQYFTSYGVHHVSKGAKLYEPRGNR